ncbi:MAG: DNA polymerase [Patescibacteria group bacterium]
MSGKKKKLILLDAHSIIHRAYHALPNFTSAAGEPTGGLYGLVSMLTKIISDFSPDYLIAAYDLPGPTFRREIYEDYKSGRPAADRELVAQIKRSRDVLTAFHIPTFDAAGFEADDIIGTLVAQTTDDLELEVIIASGDMDTLQLVSGRRVRVFTLKRGLNETIIYDEEAVRQRFGFGPELMPDYKGLRGDPSDNIIGIKGIGEKTAAILIQNFGSIEQIYLKLKSGHGPFLKVGLTERVIKLLVAGEEEALFSKTLATIRRDAPVSWRQPALDWRQEVNRESVNRLLNDLGFKSLLGRVGALWSDASGAATVADGTPNIVFTTEERARLRIAACLLDPERSDPTDEQLLAAKDNLAARLKEQGLDTVYRQIELPLWPILERATRRGITLDLDYLRVLSADYHRRLAVVSKKIFKLVGHDFNLNSPKQLAQILFDELKLNYKGLKKTAGGARSTRESELVKLRDVHPVVAELLPYRELQKLLSTYIDNLPALTDEDGVLHTTFDQCGATTGRLSSRHPNLQNIPVSGELGRAVRQAFVARPGHVLAAFDYSQIEMRVLALLSGDAGLNKIFATGADIHAGVAARVFGVKENEVTKEMRRRAKVINFGIIYGMGINALRENLGVSRQEAVEFYDHYFTAFAQIKNYFESIKQIARQTGYTRTLFGRRRYLPAINSPLPALRAAAERMAINAPLQGTAADIVKIAMIKVDEYLTTAGLAAEVHLLLQVHDELIYELPIGKLARVKPEIKTLMEQAIETTVPLVINASSGTNWAELN